MEANAQNAGNEYSANMLEAARRNAKDLETMKDNNTFDHGRASRPFSQTNSAEDGIQLGFTSGPKMNVKDPNESILPMKNESIDEFITKQSQSVLSLRNNSPINRPSS